MTELPELTDELLGELRKIYQGAQPTRKGSQSSTHNGLRAVYEHLRTLSTRVPTVLQKAIDADAGHARSACGGDCTRHGTRLAIPLTPEPGKGPWDVLVSRKTGTRYEPVRLIVEALSAIALAFPDLDIGDMGRVEFADRDTGHLLVQRLPWEDTIVLTEGEEIVRDLDDVGYRVVIPGVPPELVNLPE